VNKVYFRVLRMRTRSIVDHVPLWDEVGWCSLFGLGLDGVLLVVLCRRVGGVDAASCCHVVLSNEDASSFTVLWRLWYWSDVLVGLM